MGLFDSIRRAHTLAVESPVLRPTAVVSPFQTQIQLPAAINIDPELEKLLAVQAGSAGPVTRLQALSVPSIAKGRALLHSIIATRALVALRGAERVNPQPTWLYRSDTGVSPAQRTAAILDDILFNEASLLAVQRGEGDAILDAAHVPYDRWTVDAQGQLLVDQKPVPAGSVIWIPGPGPGLLVTAAAAIRGAIGMDEAWQRRVRNPLPAMVLKEVNDGEVSAQEAADAVRAVAKARQDIDNAVMFLPAKFELETHASESTDLFETGRNALRLDIANFMNIPAALLEGSMSTASLTYSTQEGQRNELLDYCIPYWAGPIEQALSLDSVVPRGQRVRFDFADLTTTTTSPTGPNAED